MAALAGWPPASRASFPVEPSISQAAQKENAEQPHFVDALCPFPLQCDQGLPPPAAGPLPRVPATPPAWDAGSRGEPPPRGARARAGAAPWRPAPPPPSDHLPAGSGTGSKMADAQRAGGALAGGDWGEATDEVSSRCCYSISGGRSCLQPQPGLRVKVTAPSGRLTQTFEPNTPELNQNSSCPRGTCTHPCAAVTHGQQRCPQTAAMAGHQPRGTGPGQSTFIPTHPHRAREDTRRGKQLLPRLHLLHTSDYAKRRQEALPVAV